MFKSSSKDLTLIMQDSLQDSLSFRGSRVLPGLLDVLKAPEMRCWWWTQTLRSETSSSVQVILRLHHHEPNIITSLCACCITY